MKDVSGVVGTFSLSLFTQTTFCLNKLTNIACIDVNVEGVGIVWQETRGRKVWNSILSR